MAQLKNITNRGLFLREVSAFPGGVTNDGVIGFTIDGKFYVRNQIGKKFRSQEVGIYADGSDQTTRAQAVLNHASVKVLELDAENADITINGTLTIPTGKTLKFVKGTRIIGTGTISGKVDAPDDAEIFATTLNLNSVEPSRGYLPVGWYGVKGDGVTDASTALQKMSTNTKATEIRFNLPKGSSILHTTSLSFATKVLKFTEENKITGTGGLVSATFDAPYGFHILDSNIVLTYPRSVTDKFSVKWMGAKGDNSTDDSAVFLKITSGVANLSPLTILIPNTGSQSQYIINSTISTNGNSLNKIWEFQVGAIIKGTGTLNGISVKAHPRFKIFENTLTLISIYPENERFSVRWVGAGFGTSNTTDDTAAVQKAQNAVDERWKLYFPAGTYYLAGPVIISETVGDGRRTILKPTSVAAANTPVLKVGRHVAQGDVGLADITDLIIDGNSTNYGVEFNNGGNNDLYSGRWRFKNVHFSACTRSVNKPRGNFGNVFDGCAFSGNVSTEYHVYSQDEVAMHTGLDKFYNCRFYGSRKAAIYINDEEGGGTRIQDCVFEYNYGFCVFIKTGGVNHHILPVVIDNCWLEGNAHGEVNAFDDAGGVDINGEVFTKAYDFYFEKCNSVKLQNTALGRIRAINSNVFIDTVANGSLGGSYIDSDEHSVIINKSEFGFGTLGKDFSFDKVALATPSTIARVKTSFPYLISPSTNGLRKTLPLNTLTGLTFTGTQTRTIVDDGPLYNKALEISNVVTSGYINETIYSASAIGKYIVVGIGLKLVSGTKAVLYDANAGRVNITEDEVGSWRYHYTIYKATDTNTRAFYIDSTGNIGNVFRISAFQVVEFDTRQAAYEFIHQGLYLSSVSAYGDVYTTLAQTITNKTLGTGTKINLGTTAEGDIYYTGADGILIRLPKGADGQVLKLLAGIPSWQNESGGTGGTVAYGSLRTVVANTTFTTADETILVDTSSGNVTITVNVLPAGMPVYIKKISEDVNIVTIVPVSGTIDTNANYVLDGANESIMMKSDGTNLYIIK